MVEVVGKRKIYGVIYRFICIVTGKAYIGKTQYFKKRISNHKSNAEKRRDLKRNSKCAFYRAIRKYGWCNFSVGVIDSACSIEELSKKEIYWIKKLNTFKGTGYNMTPGGDGTSGYSHTKSAKKKIREAQLGEKHYLYGKHPSKETLRRQSDSHKGVPLTEKCKKNMSLSKRGSKAYQWGKMEDLHLAANKRGGKCLDNIYQGRSAIYSWKCSAGHIFKARGRDICSNRWCASCHWESIRGEA
jgi:group I intron endonuclease